MESSAASPRRPSPVLHFSLCTLTFALSPNQPLSYTLPMPSRLRLGLVGPDLAQPCGIADYTARLAQALAESCDLAFVPFRDALTDPRLPHCMAILVQYERSLVPDGGFLDRLGARFPGRVYVVPHEVYAEDPFAFPYAGLRASFPPLLWLKRWRYRRSHRAYAEEKRLQARGYGAHRVIPLSGPGAEILRALAGGKVLDTVPLAYPDLASPSQEASMPGGGPAPEARFPVRPKAVLGIFGFLNPGLDYASVLDLLARLDPGVGLLILGGARGGGDAQSRLEAAIAERGLQDRARVTGFLPEASLQANLRLCDVFLCPMRFKSNSSSVAHLFGLGKPILATELPLTRFLQDQGAPIELYAGPEELRSKADAALSGALPARANRYPWDFRAVADAYLRILGAAHA